MSCGCECERVPLRVGRESLNRCESLLGSARRTIRRSQPDMVALAWWLTRGCLPPPNESSELQAVQGPWSTHAEILNYFSEQVR